MQKRIPVLLASMLLMTSSAMSSENSVLFNQIFAAWTNAFNHKDLAGSCGLFSDHVTADYQGVPIKNYNSICDGFKKIFKENRSYHYSYKIRNIYQSHDLAAVRITWYLRIIDTNKNISTIRDEGIDIFELDQQNQWKIVNYLGFPVIDRK